MNELEELERQLGPGLRRTLDTMLVTDHEPAMPGPQDRPAPDSASRIRPTGRSDVGRRRHRLFGVAAATVLIAGIGGLIVATNRPGDDATQTPAASNEVVGEPAAVTTPGASSPAPAGPEPVSATDPGNDVSGVYLPSTPIQGFTLTDIQVNAPYMLRPERATVRYLRAAGAGEESALVVATVDPAPTDTEGDGRPGSITVHGVSAHIYDSGDGVVVQWEDDGHVFGLRGVGVSWDAMADYAERSVLDADGRLIVPGIEADGFTVTANETPAPADAAETVLNYLPHDDSAEHSVTIASTVNSDGLTLEALEADKANNPGTLDHATVGGVPALVLTSPAGDFGPIVGVQWLRDGFILVVTARLPVSDVLAIAETVEPATMADARALNADVEAALAALPEVDRATLPNGFEVSIHATRTTADVICLHQPVKHCEAMRTEAPPGTDYQAVTYPLFSVEGETWLVSWAEGTHQPTRVVGTQSDGAITDVARGTAGTFVAMTSAVEGEGFRFDPDDQTVFPATTGETSDLLHGS